MKTAMVSNGAGRYVVGQYERFDQRNDMYKRPRWDHSEAVQELGRWANMVPDEKRPGYTLLDLAYRHAGWYFMSGDTTGSSELHKGMFAWESSRWGHGRPFSGLQLTVDSPEKMSKIIKRAARFFGASLVGIAELDMRWVYSHSYSPRTEEHEPIEIPAECKYVIALAFDMDYDYYRYSPTQIEGATTAMAYARMPFTSGLLSQFIRGLGYKALPMGNDTALSIPISIDAGLGELARNGLLVTPEFGPRVRLAKVVTDLPLAPDRPVEFGVWDFCKSCEKCATLCPGRSIMSGEPTTEIHNISNNKGILRWPMNAEKCLGFWKQNGGNCGVCIRVCPFNKPPGLMHNLVKLGVKHTPWMDPLFVKMDDWMGYGRKAKAEHFWD